MRRFRFLAVLILAAAIGGCAGTRDDFYDDDSYYDDTYEAQGDYPAHVGYFYDDLAPYGHWYQRAPYGWVWSPSGVSAGWRPYTVGSWAYSDWGWTWMSADPWGYAPYHYGRWTYDTFYGWLWIPDDTWAPAWVAWRYGGGYVGWAPLPPDAVWRSDYGLDDWSSIDAGRWAFVRDRDFVTSRNRVQVFPTAKNTTYIQRTRDVTRYSVVEGRPAERGLDVAALEKNTGRKIPRYQLVAKATGLDREVVRGRALEVPRPVIARNKRYTMKASPPPPAVEARERARARRGESPGKSEEARERIEPKDSRERETPEQARERQEQARERAERAREQQKVRERASERRESVRERHRREQAEREEARIRVLREREEARAREARERGEDPVTR